MRKYALLIILTLIFAIGCSSTRVAVDFDENFDFSQLQKFAFVKPPQQKTPGVIHDPLFIKKAKNEIAAQLTKRGFELANSRREADFLIAFYATTKNKVQITPPTYHIGRYGRRWVTPGHAYHYKQGTLIIDIVDKKSKELVWRGVGTGVLDRDKPIKNLIEAVRDVLKDFPPK